MSIIKRFTLPAAGAVLALAGVAGLAVSTGRAQPQRTVTVDQAYRVATMAQMAITVYAMDNAGLHDLAEATAAGNVPAGSLGKVQRVRILAAATQWPDAIAADAKEFVEYATSLEASLKAEDAAKAAPDADEVHELGHKISAAFYDMMARAAGGAPTAGDDDQ